MSKGSKIFRLFRIFFLLAAFLTGLQARAQYDRDRFFYRGREALSDGKYAEAIENFNILARLDTADYQNFFFRGIAKFNLGDLRGAWRDFDRSVRINPLFTSGYHFRAIAFSRTGDYDAALQDLERAISLRPGMVGLYYSRGVTYFLSQQFDKALEDFNRYIRKEPKDANAYLSRGATWFYLKDTLKAIADYNRAIRLDRYDPEGYIRRGRIQAARGHFREAVEDMDHALELDSTATFAWFNRALMHYELKNYRAAMADLDKVLELDPGNALTRYNRGLILAQLGEFERALQDLDRVIGINPGNVLAYFNRASVFIGMQRWQDALEDYDKAIELYPDFAKAYLNRSYVKNMLGMTRSSKEDWKTAQRKVQEYRAKQSAGALSFADTTRKYSSLLALDADFAKKDFDNELLQHRDIDIRLRPLYRFVRTEHRAESYSYLITRRYENPLMSRFLNESPVPLSITADGAPLVGPSGALSGSPADLQSFIRALDALGDRQFNTALQHYTQAIREGEGTADPMRRLYTAYYYLNRAVLRADMIDFIASIENNVQVLTLDDQGTTRARVSERVSRRYDYSDALEDLRKAAGILEDCPYVWYNLGNLSALSSDHLAAIREYSRAISLYPYMGDAYFNRGLVLIYLKDKEKGCIDLSRAGELGVGDAYGVIKKYCEEEPAR